MAGHLGAEQVTVQNLEIVLTDPERGLLGIRGAVPGNPGGYVLIRDAVKKKAPKDLPYPAAFVKASTAVKEETSESAPTVEAE